MRSYLKSDSTRSVTVNFSMHQNNLEGSLPQIVGSHPEFPVQQASLGRLLMPELLPQGHTLRPIAPHLSERLKVCL